MARRGWLRSLTAVGVIALIAIEATAVAAASSQVAAVNYEFSPSSLTVSVGDTVVWTMSGDGHTVRSGTVGADNIGHPSDGPLESGFKGPGESYSFTFAQAGTYEYFCEIHPEQMKGTITVVGAPAGGSPTGAIIPSPSAAGITPPPTAGTPSAAVTPAATPASGGGQSPTSDTTPPVVGGVVLVLAVLGLVLGLARRRR
jgi:plastocyanin